MPELPDVALYVEQSCAARFELVFTPDLLQRYLDEDLFLTILSRRPTADEQKLLRNHANKAGSLETATRELAWALLMTSEFSLNH